MAALRQQPSRQFREEVLQAELELRGLPTRAFQFEEGVRDPRRALVCIAGMGANGRSFARQRPLAQRAFVLMLNTPPETPRKLDPLAFAADSVEDYLEHEGLELPTLLGSSFGGAVAATIALRRPDRVRAMVLVSPVLARSQIPLAFPGFVDVIEAPQPVAALVAPLAAQLMGGFALDRDGRDEIVREARHFTSTELKRRLRTLMELDLLPALRKLELPILWLHGGRDLLVPWRRARKAAEAIGARRFELIPGAGHLPYLSHPVEFNQEVFRFLSELDA
ncbi:MAG: alpha/beta hydrolase [Myxococcaceae bacterium]